MHPHQYREDVAQDFGPRFWLENLDPLPHKTTPLFVKREQPVYIRNS